MNKEKELIEFVKRMLKKGENNANLKLKDKVDVITYRKILKRLETLIMNKNKKT